MANQRVHEFAEKVTLITNGSAPVARAAALQLAMQGAFVICVSPGPSVIAAQLRELGTLAISVDADPATAEGAEKAASEIEAAYGRLDLLVNCFTAEPAEADHLQRAAEHLMAPRPSPKIVNVMPLEAEDAKDESFVARRGALAAYTASLADSLPKNFRVNGLAVRNPPAEEMGDLFRSVSGVSADDAARVICFLLSAEAKALNGQILTAE